MKENEQEFRRQLAALINRFDHDTTGGTQKESDTWWDDWFELLYVATDDQCNRAEDLLALHINNRDANLDGEDDDT